MEDAVPEQDDRHGELDGPPAAHQMSDRPGVPGRPAVEPGDEEARAVSAHDGQDGEAREDRDIGGGEQEAEVHLHPDEREEERDEEAPGHRIEDARDAPVRLRPALSRVTRIPA